MSNINKYNDNFVMYVPKIIHDNWKINDEGKVLLILDKHNIITKFSSWMLNKDINKDIASRHRVVQEPHSAELYKG